MQFNNCIVYFLGETLRRLVVQRHLCFERKKKEKGEINLLTVYYKYQMPTDRVWNIHGIHVFTFNQ